VLNRLDLVWFISGKKFLKFDFELFLFEIMGFILNSDKLVSVSFFFSIGFVNLWVGIIVIFPMRKNL